MDTVAVAMIGAGLVVILPGQLWGWWIKGRDE